ncbi:Crp/Fnr family transcriptional regulator [Candidatus Roizmanbacteria bacterium]|nr:Crp/Fnr family transcriptional regulator [Candidatus Roizmanbacteria bacterium]
MEMQAKKKLSVFFSKYQTVRYKKRETLFRPGDIPQGVNYIKKGHARLYTVSAEGKELSLVIYEPGNVFPVVWTVKGVPSIYYFESLTDLQTQRAPREDFVTFINKNTDVFYEFTRGITSRFQIALRRMEWLAFGNAKERVSSILMILAEMYGVRERRDVAIQIPLTHRDIAALVGMTRETVSVEVKKLEKKGYVEKQKGVYIVKDYAGLREESLLED